jgi:hypothetical protein
VIFNLDYFMFSPKWEEHWAPSETGMPFDFGMLQAAVEGWSTLVNGVKTSPRQTLAGLVERIIHPLHEQLDGLRVFGPTPRAGVFQAFRYDGSMLYFPEVFGSPSQVMGDLKVVLNMFPEGAGERMDPGQIERLRRLAELARKRGVTLVGVQLPFPKTLVDVLDAGQDYVEDGHTYRGTDMRIWREFESDKTRALFSDMGILFFDFARLPSSANAQAFVNSAHPAEYLTLLAVIEMLSNARLQALLPELDRSALERAARQAEASHNYIAIFRNQF